MNDSLCSAMIRPFRPVNDTEVPCGLPSDDHTLHQGVIRDYAFPGSTTILNWAEDDRRTFHGEWAPCAVPGCILPFGHRGDDAGPEGTGVSS